MVNFVEVSQELHDDAFAAQWVDTEGTVEA
jgi:hypothetical protein